MTKTTSSKPGRHCQGPLVDQGTVKGALAEWRADDGTGRAGRRGSPAAAGHSLQRLPAVFLLKDTRAASGAPCHPPNATAAKGSSKAATHALGNPHWIKSARRAGSGRRSQGQWAVSLNTPQGTQCRKKNYVLLKSGIHPSFPSHVLSSNIWKKKKNLP